MYVLIVFGIGVGLVSVYGYSLLVVIFSVTDFTLLVNCVCLGIC